MSRVCLTSCEYTFLYPLLIYIEYIYKKKKSPMINRQGNKLIPQLIVIHFFYYYSKHYSASLEKIPNLC